MVRQGALAGPVCLGRELRRIPACGQSPPRARALRASCGVRRSMDPRYISHQRVDRTWSEEGCPRRFAKRRVTTGPSKAARTGQSSFLPHAAADVRAAQRAPRNLGFVRFFARWVRAAARAMINGRGRARPVPAVPGRAIARRRSGVWQRERLRRVGEAWRLPTRQMGSKGERLGASAEGRQSNRAWEKMQIKAGREPWVMDSGPWRS